MTYKITYPMILVRLARVAYPVWMYVPDDVHSLLLSFVHEIIFYGME